MSTRVRALPWFRDPGARYDQAVEHEWAHLLEPPLLVDGGEEPFTAELRAMRFGPDRLLCEVCFEGGADVRHRLATPIDELLIVNRVLRYDAQLCDRCAKEASRVPGASSPASSEDC